MTVWRISRDIDMAHDVSESAGAAPLFFMDTDSADAAPASPRAPKAQKRARTDDGDAWHRRYLGTLVLSGYSMIKGASTLRSGDRVILQRKSKPKTKSTSSRGRHPRANERVDYIVRFGTSRGTWWPAHARLRDRAHSSRRGRLDVVPDGRGRRRV